MSNEQQIVSIPSTSSAEHINLTGVGCGFCGNRRSNLQACLFCGSVFYCTIEHQQLDWKDHKMTCRTLQLQPRSLDSTDTESTRTTFTIVTKNDIPTCSFATEGSAFRPYRQVKGQPGKSPSSLSSLNEHGNKTAPIKVLSLNNTNINEELSSKHNILIPTDDPDIQIIENEFTNKKTPNRVSRKRPTPSNSADLKIKDHNKNLVYSTTLQEHQRHLHNRGLALSLHQAMVLRLRYIAEHVIRSLNEFGWAVVDNFLGSDHYKYTAKEIERLYDRGLFSPGQLMEGKHKDEFHIKDIRSDHIYWFDGSDDRAQDAATVRLLISMIDSVIQHFKKRIDHDIGGRSRAMLAIYPGNGTRYVKHVDNPVKDGRCITTIYYCNENWDMKKDGGTLRLYPETSLTPMDIDPRADRLVFFWSDRRNPHEVMPVFRYRFAITIWYMDKNERERSMVRGKENPKKDGDGTPTRPRKNPSTQDLSSLDLRLFPTTSSDPTLGQANAEKCNSRILDSANTGDCTSNAPTESNDSGISFSLSNRVNSIESISDSLQSERDRRNSRGSDHDMDDTSLPPPTSQNPEYMI